MQDVKELQELHHLCTDHVMIRSQLKYLIGAKVVRLKCRVFGGKTGPMATVRVFVWQKPLPRFGSGPNPNPELF
jgi:hypothetical protein